MAPKSRELQPQLSNALDQLVDVWFPRVVDYEHGGYLCDFDHRWRGLGPDNKLLEYQARTLRFAARVAHRYPDLQSAAELGFRFLADIMWDTDHGGWYRMVDRRGTPLEGSVKHAHGMAYAVSACICYYKLTGSDESLQLAQRGFDWLEKHAHDSEYGGYYSYFRRDGALISSSAASGNARPPLDPLGNPVGFKESNTTVDLLETFTEFYAVAPSVEVLNRLEELLRIVLDHVIAEPGATHLAFSPSWQPVPHLNEYAHSLQTARTLIEASASFPGGALEDAARAAGKNIVDNMLRVAWDHSRGGFNQAGWAFGPCQIEGVSVYVREKVFWCQAEGMRALSLLARILPEQGYEDWEKRLWQYIDKYVVDRRRGGWNQKGSDSPGYDRRAAKASVWKDPGHEGSALLVALEPGCAGPPVSRTTSGRHE